MRKGAGDEGNSPGEYYLCGEFNLHFDTEWDLWPRLARTIPAH